MRNLLVTIWAIDKDGNRITKTPHTTKPFTYCDTSIHHQDGYIWDAKKVASWYIPSNGAGYEGVITDPGDKGKELHTFVVMHGPEGQVDKWEAYTAYHESRDTYVNDQY